MKPYRLLALALLLGLNAQSGAVDQDANGLSDVWEQRFGAGDLEPLNDEDGDGYSNVAECIAGTDPFDGNDRPRLLPLNVNESPAEIQIQFGTEPGKLYTVTHSNDLSVFSLLPPQWQGDGNIRSIRVNTTEGANQVRTTAPVVARYWGNLASNTLDSLEGISAFPSIPDATINHPRPEALDLLAAGYGAQLKTWITPPQTGNYTFFISSGGPAALYGTDPTEPQALAKLAEILPAQTGLEPNDWETFGTQRSIPISLTAGEPYAIELRYVAATANQHTQIAWLGPGIDGIKTIDQTVLSSRTSLSSPFSGSTLLMHDYDSAGQTTELWGTNTVAAVAPTGMNGQAEYITGSSGNSNAQRYVWGSPIGQHFYARWRMHVVSDSDFFRVYFEDGDNSRVGPVVGTDVKEGEFFIGAGGNIGITYVARVNYGETYLIEIIGSLTEGGFTYNTLEGPKTVVKDHFDFYISDSAGNLIGSAQSLEHRDENDPLDQYTRMRLIANAESNVYLDDWTVTDGSIDGSGYLLTSQFTFSDADGSNFFKLGIEEQDQDGDGIPDWEELALGTHAPLLFFDAQTIDGTPDITTLSNLLTLAQDAPEIMLFGSDACAIENNYPNTIPDDGEITLVREGELTPLTVHLEIIPLEDTDETNTVCDGTCCMLVGTAGDEAAEPEDYQIIDEDGTVITDTVNFEFGETTKVLRVIAIQDTINEYPETLNIAVAASPDGSYTTSALMNGASIQLFDLPDSPDNVTIFTGNFSKDGRAAGIVNGSGSVVATINGTRTEVRLWSQFSNLTSPQQDSHVHKASIGNGPGDIVYAITNTPGGESGPEPGSDPFNGQLEYYPLQILAGETVPEGVSAGEGYPWDLTESSGAVPTGGATPTKQAIIDSLFGQNGETPLYFNIHTVDNPAGEIWAFFGLSEGSVDAPDAPEEAAAPGSSDYPQLSGTLLEAEVRRFLNQATFGSTDTSVDALLTDIENKRLSNPNYHRHQTFETWIDQQMDPSQTTQTYLLDYFTASYMQFLKLAGVFDPLKNPTDGQTATPIAPGTWPRINRDDPNSEMWYLDRVFPLTLSDYQLADNTNDLIVSAGFNNLNRTAFNQVMINARDQLRQKMGFALQQIVVVSKSQVTIRNQPLGSLNYQDQLNANAFGYYRDVLGYVNWSPIMGTWLSSLKNQKAIDFDGDGLFDSYPDENLARENMQLFSIGLFNIWPDGTLRLTPNGLPEASYTNADIQEFAKILTGQGFSRRRNIENDYVWGGSPFEPNNDNFNERHFAGLLGEQFLYPMKMFGDYHSLGVKTFAGTTIDNTHLTDFTAQGVADIEAAIDWLAGVPGDGLPDFNMVNSHVSTPAFISRRLIQRFTTSNPSTEYLHRVATVFKETEGDLGRTLKAILLDPEARNLDLDDTRFGLKKSPMEGYIQLLRAFDAHGFIPLEDPQGTSPYDQAPGDFSNSDLYLGNFDYPAEQLNNFERNVRIMFNSFYSIGNKGLQMNPFEQETVFNYYLPDFSPGGVVGNAGMVAPELQLANEPDIVRNINYFEQITRVTAGQQGSVDLGGSSEIQSALFASPDAGGNDNTRLPLQAIADRFYPATAPDNSSDPFGRTSISLADEMMLDELDRRLTNGLFKMRYPYDPTDDDDPDSPGTDDLLKNPRELMIDSIHGFFGNPWDGNDDDQNRRNRLENLLFLLSVSPEYQVRK